MKVPVFSLIWPICMPHMCASLGHHSSATPLLPLDGLNPEGRKSNGVLCQFALGAFLEHSSARWTRLSVSTGPTIDSGPRRFGPQNARVSRPRRRNPHVSMRSAKRNRANLNRTCACLHCHQGPSTERPALWAPVYGTICALGNLGVNQTESVTN